MKKKLPELAKLPVKDLPDLTPEELGLWYYLAALRISQATKQPIQEVIDDLRDTIARLEKEIEPEVERLRAEGYPPKLAMKIAVGFHPNTREPMVEWLLKSRGNSRNES
jgi:hypothetical protein